jgi:spoIIIJ-associated protein
MTETQPSIEVIAPTVEEAVQRGAAELGVPEIALDVEILDEGSRGVLGVGSRQARVRLTLIDDASENGEAGAESDDHDSMAFDDDVDDSPNTLRLAREVVEDLLRHMDLKAEVAVRWGERDAPHKARPLFVDITGNDLSLLIGRRGDTLDSMQYIVRLILGKELHKPIAAIIDVEGYRARREQTLRRLARRMAEQALERGRSLALEPMPPNERRVIHLELRHHPHVRTESVGEGSERKVTIIPNH